MLAKHLKGIFLPFLVTVAMEILEELGYFVKNLCGIKEDHEKSSSKKRKLESSLVIVERVSLMEAELSPLQPLLYTLK